jgi:hypothetical protein
MSGTEHPSSRELENGRVALWRLDQFLRLGFGDEDAFQLAGSDVDLGLVRSLVAASCPRQLALRIVL